MACHTTALRPRLSVFAQMGSDTIELPAGLLDPGEDAATAALRELKEETGYTAKVCLDGGCTMRCLRLTELCGAHLRLSLTHPRQVVSVSPTACMSPGLTNETVHLVHGAPQSLLPQSGYAWADPFLLNARLQLTLTWTTP